MAKKKAISFSRKIKIKKLKVTGFEKNNASKKNFRKEWFL